LGWLNIYDRNPTLSQLRKKATKNGFRKRGKFQGKGIREGKTTNQMISIVKRGQKRLVKTVRKKGEGPSKER